MMVQLNGLGLGLGSSIPAIATAVGPAHEQAIDGLPWYCSPNGPFFLTSTCQEAYDLRLAEAQGHYQAPDAPPAPPTPPDMDPVTGEVLNPDAVDNLIAENQRQTVDHARQALDKVNTPPKSDIPWYVWALLAGAGYIAIKKGI